VQADPMLLQDYPVVDQAMESAASITDLEFRYGVIDARKHRAVSPRAFFYFKDRKESSQVDVDRLSDLEDRVRALEFPVREFSSPVGLGEWVRADMLEAIERDFADAKPPTPLETERMKHRAFAASRKHAYLPNHENIERLDAFADSSGADPLVIVAESGSGKSSLAAYWSDHYQHLHPELKTIQHFIGSTDRRRYQHLLTRSRRSSRTGSDSPVKRRLCWSWMLLIS
jgi:hypothetical protein